MSSDGMADTVIHAEGLGKLYRIGQLEPYKTLRDALSRAVLAPFRAISSARADHRTSSGSSEPEAFVWALRDVSFDVSEGEAIGIIGRNGAGKTTLLKILSRITKPTEGRAEVRGRVGSLLEVGTGFHPELTGRENVYLYGAVLGMKRREIDDSYDDIVGFAEVEKFMDTPLKRYSSGMQVRLAFAVAAHLEPEILLVDEVLAVGDAAFQEKCLGRMGTVAREGRTVLFVSHNMGAIISLTHDCIYLDNGRIVAYDETRQVVQQYLADTLEHRTAVPSDFEFYRRDRSSESPVRITRIWVNEPSRTLPTVEFGSGFTVIVELEVYREIRGANLTIVVKDFQGRRIVVLYSGDQGFFLSLPPGTHVVACQVPDLPITPGKYLVDVGINQSTETLAFDVIVDFPLLEVANRGQVTQWLDRPWGGVHWENVQWAIQRSETAGSGSRRPTDC